MNNFFSYVKGDMDQRKVFYDSDFKAPDGDEDDFVMDETEGTDADPELEEAIRFITGDNIAFEEVIFGTQPRRGLKYIAYIHTKNQINVIHLRDRVAEEIDARMKSGFSYKLSVEEDRSTYSKSKKEYVIKIET